MFLLALTAGLRQGELIALKWSDLNIKERTLTISESRSVERRELVEYKGGTRTISLTTEAVGLLRMERARHPSSSLMFMHPATQKPYSPQMVRRMHNEIIKEAGLDRIRFADLRAHLRRPISAKRNGHERGFSDAGAFPNFNDATELRPLPGQPRRQKRKQPR